MQTPTHKALQHTRHGSPTFLELRATSGAFKSHQNISKRLRSYIVLMFKLLPNHVTDRVSQIQWKKMIWSKKCKVILKRSGRWLSTETRTRVLVWFQFLSFLLKMKIVLSLILIIDLNSRQSKPAQTQHKLYYFKRFFSYIILQYLFITYVTRDRAGDPKYRSYREILSFLTWFATNYWR